MPVSAVLSAWIALAVVLALGGVSKLRHPAGAVDAVISLRVPTALRRPWLIRAHPWGELLLAGLLLVLPHPLSVVTAAVALVLLLGYLLLVCRVVASGDRATCHCFGSVGSGAVDGWTLARNGLLVVLGLIVLVDAVLGESAIGRLRGLGAGGSGGPLDREAGGGAGPETWWWVAALAVTAALTYLVVRPGDRPTARTTTARADISATSTGTSAGTATGTSAGTATGTSAGTATGTSASAPADAPVLRLPIPDVPVRVTPDGPALSLQDVVHGRPQLLLLLSPGCGPCRMVAGRLSDWQHDLPSTGLLVVHTDSFAVVHESVPQWAPFFVQDVEGAVARVFDDPARPWAVLVDADGRIGSAPAQGYTAITDLVSSLLSSDHAGAC